MRVYADLEDLARAARAELLRRAEDLIAERGRFTLALSGGSTPRRLYELLAEADLDWSRVEFFFGDERCVPPDHPDSNYRMAREALFDPARVPERNVHRMRGELEPARGAAAYEDELRAVLGAPSLPGRNEAPPVLDFVLLGLGEDGHTASLFPGTAALDERARWVVANHVPRLDAWRLTLTFPVLNAASGVAFLVTGSEKRDVVTRILAPSAGDPDDPLPAARVSSAQGRLIWMLDAAAAPGG